MAALHHRTILVSRAFFSDEPVQRRFGQFFRGKGKANVLYVEAIVWDMNGDRQIANFITFGHVAAALAGFLRMGSRYNVDYIDIDEVDDELLQVRIANEFFDARFDLYEPEDIGQYVGVLVGANSIDDRLEQW